MNLTDTLNNIRTRKEFDGLQKHEALSHYSARFVMEFDSTAVYEVTNNKSGHKYTVKVKPPIRLHFISPNMDDTPRGKCVCPREIQPCQHLMIATWENEKRAGRELSESFFNTFEPSMAIRKKLRTIT